jgi:uncharacterized protein YjbI with pentapeptide repeats
MPAWSAQGSLHGASLHGASLHGASLHGASLHGANPVNPFWRFAVGSKAGEPAASR